MKQGKILPRKEIHETGSYPVFGANGCIGYCEDYFLEEQCVLITCRGSTCGVVNQSPPRSFVTNNAMILFEKDCLDNDFLFFVLQEFSTERLKTGSGQPQLTKGILNSHVIPLPPLPEQKKIAHVLSTVQRAIEAQERIVQTTTELKKALMHKLFTEGLRNEPQKQTEIGPIPESWEVCTVPDSLQRTRVSRKHQIPAKAIAETGAHPVVDQGQSFVAGFTNDSERLIDFDLPLVIFGDHTRCLKFVDFPFVLGADGTKVLKSNPELFDPKFFFYALVALDLPSRGYNRHFKLLKEKSVPRPPIAEQRDIATAIDTAAHKCSSSESKRSVLQDLFRTLLHELMTAKTRVSKVSIPTTT